MLAAFVYKILLSDIKEEISLLTSRNNALRKNFKNVRFYLVSTFLSMDWLWKYTGQNCIQNFVII